MVFYAQSSKPPVRVEGVMELPLSQLAQLAWPLLTNEERCFSLTDLSFPHSMRASSSPRSTETTFAAGIDTFAAGVAQQLRDIPFADVPLAACRLRSVIFAQLLQYGSSTRQSGGTHSDAEPQDIFEFKSFILDNPYLRGGCGGAATGTATGGSRAASSTSGQRPSLSGSSTQHSSAAISSKENRARSRSLTPPPQAGSAASRLSGSSQGDAAMRKTKSIVEECTKAGWESVVAFALGEESGDTAVCGKILRTAMALCRDAPTSPEAGYSFVCLLRSVLRSISTAPDTIQGRSLPNDTEDEMTQRRRQISMLVHVAIPLLHLVPLVSWTSDVLAELASVLEALVPSPLTAFWAVMSKTEKARSDSDIVEFEVHIPFRCSSSSWSVHAGHAAAAVASDAARSPSAVATEREAPSAPSSEWTDSNSSRQSSTLFREIPEMVDGVGTDPLTEPESELVRAEDTAAEEEAEEEENEEDDDEYATTSSMTSMESSTNTGEYSYGSQLFLYGEQQEDELYKNRVHLSVYALPHASRVLVTVREAKASSMMSILLLPLESEVCSPGAAASPVQVTRGDRRKPMHRLTTLLPASSGPIIHTGDTLEYKGPCRVAIACNGVPSSGVVSGTVTASIQLTLDGRIMTEWRGVLAAAQRRVAELLLDAMEGRLRNPTFLRRHQIASSSLFRGGLKMGVDSPSDGPLAAACGASVADSFAQSLIEMPDMALRTRVRCRSADTAGVRATLITIAYFFGHLPNSQENLTWRSKPWLDAVRRVSLSSSAVGACSGAMEVAQLILHQIAVSYPATPPQIIDAAIQLFSIPNLSVEEMRATLEERRQLSITTRTVVDLLMKSCARCRSPRHVALVSRATRQLLLCGCQIGTRAIPPLSDPSALSAQADGSYSSPALVSSTPAHYLTFLYGSGKSAEASVRCRVHSLIELLFRLLQALLLRTRRSQAAPHRFLMEPWEYGPFAVLTLSFLSTPMDAADLQLCAVLITEPLTLLLPSFTRLSRTESFLLETEEEKEFLVFLANQMLGKSSSLFRPGDEESRRATTLLSESDGRASPGLPSPYSVSLRNVKWNQRGVFEPLAEPANVFSVGPILNLESEAHLGPRHIEIQFLSSELDNTFIGFSSSTISTKKPVMIVDDKGIFLYADGSIQYGGHRGAAQLPAWRRGDVIGLSFVFATSAWDLVVTLNDVVMVRFALLDSSVRFVVSATNSTPPNVKFRGVFDCSIASVLPPSATDGGNSNDDDGESASIVPPVSLTATHRMMHADQRLSPFSKPTLFNISLFSELVLHYFVLRCATVHHPHLAPPAKLSTTAGPSHEAGHSLLHGCIASLQQSVSQLVDSLQDLASPTAPSPRSEEEWTGSYDDLKRTAARHIYNAMLLDNVLTLAVAVRTSTSPVELMNQLTKVVASEAVGSKVRAVALSALYNAISMNMTESSIASFQPKALWDCCYSLALAPPLYRPRFSAVSVPPDFVAVRGGGRRLYHERHRYNVAVRSTNYAVNGIVFSDPTLPDVVRVSVRIQREIPSDTLGHYYFVGVAAVAGDAKSVLSEYPGDRLRQRMTFSIADYLSDFPNSITLPRLSDHYYNFVSPTRGVVFGPGDVVTVCVHVRTRRIGFERNGLPLGILYDTVPPNVDALFPFVELYNGDSRAEWLYAPDETALYARYTMRALLNQWPVDLLPVVRARMQPPLFSEEDGDIVLGILGADGDEMSMMYTPPPCYEQAGGEPLLVHVERFEGRMAVTTDDMGAPLRVYATALEPSTNCPVRTIASRDNSCFMQLAKLASQVLKKISPTNEEVPCPSGARSGVQLEAVLLERPVTLLRVLRLLYESDISASELTQKATELRLMSLLVELIRFLSTQCVDLNDAAMLRDAWVEAMSTEKENEPIVIYRRRQRDSSVTSTLLSESGYSDSMKTADLDLLCPTCGGVWYKCDTTHPVPTSLCYLYDQLLRFRLGPTADPSPYCSWFSRWKNLPARVSQSGKTSAHEGDANSGEGPDDGASHDTESSPDATASPPALGTTSSLPSSPPQHTLPPSIPLQFLMLRREGAAPAQGSQPSAAVDRTRDLQSPAWIEIRRVEPLRSGASKGEATSGTRVEGEGETWLASFKFTGELVSPTVLNGRMTFDNFTPSDTGAERNALSEEWSCPSCTFLNPPNSTRCSMCGTPRPGGVWACSLCNYAYNAISAPICATCGQRRAINTRRTLADGPLSYCTVCHHSERLKTLGEQRYRRYCPTCLKVTCYLPKDRYVCPMVAGLVDSGTSLELTWIVDDEVITTCDLFNDDYTAPSLRRLVVNSCERIGTTLTKEVSRYIPFLPQQRAAPDVPRPMWGTAPPAQTSALVSALVHYSSALVLRWVALLPRSRMLDATLLTNLRVHDEAWLKSIASLPVATAKRLLLLCMGLLRKGVDTPEVVQTLSSISRSLLKSHTEALDSLKHDLFYSLCLTASKNRTESVRKASYNCMSSLMEDYYFSNPINAKPLAAVLSATPIVQGQQRCAMLGLLHRTSTGSTSAIAKACACLIKTIDCMSNGRPLPPVLGSSFPYLVALTETRIGSAGQLLVGQVRGSVGVSPAKGGHYYFEVVIPPDFSDRTNMIVMGWGTLLHEQMSSSQHVGSDLHSWGFNCRDNLRLMMGEQTIPVPRRPTAGDVIGCMANLETMMLCWTLNGEEMFWVSVPMQSDGDEIYPYVSASVEPHGTIVRLGNTCFCPEDYTDFSPPPDHTLWDGEDAERDDDKDLRVPTSPAAPAPQSYEFYEQLSHALEEVSITLLQDFSSLALLRSPVTLYGLRQYPLIKAFIDNAEANPREDRERHRKRTDSNNRIAAQALAPYIEQLRHVQELTIVVARHLSLIDCSPCMMACYRKATDLLFSAGRWTIFELNAGGRPKYHGNSGANVTIDLALAESLLVEEAGDGLGGTVATSEATAATSAGAAGSPEDGGALAKPLEGTLEQRRLKNSITGQLFRHLEKLPIYQRARMFAVRLVDMVTIDAGGVTRSVMSMLADEVNFRFLNSTRADPLLPLFKLCSHSTIFTVVPNMAGFIANNSASAEDGGGLYLRMFVWLGKILGNIILCGTMKACFQFPRMVWKMLVFQDSVTIEDYAYDIDDHIVKSLSDTEFVLSNGFFTSLPEHIRANPELLRVLQGENAITSASGGPSPSGAASLAPARPLRPFLCMTPAVSLQDMSHTALEELEEMAAKVEASELAQRRAVVEEVLLHQFDPAILAMRAGLTSVVPASLLRTVSWEDLRLRVCGSVSYSSELVMSTMDTSRISSAVKTMLSEALDGMTEKQLSLFLLFCSGQSRLPLPEKILVTYGDEPHRLPTAHTCSPISLLLQPCDSADDLRSKLELCLTHANQFGFV